MLVDVLVPVVLVDLQAQLGDLRKDVGGDPQLHHEFDAAARVRAQQELDQLVADALGRDDGQPVGHVAGGLGHLRGQLEAELGGEADGPHDAQRVVAEGVLRPAGRAQDALGQVREPAEGVDELLAGQAHGHSVHREVAAQQVVVDVVAVVDVRLARLRGVGLAAVGRDLHLQALLAQADRAELDADGPHGVGPAVDQFEDALGDGVRGEVHIVGGSSEERVTDRPADDGELLVVSGEAFAELVGDGAHGVEQGGDRRSLLARQCPRGAVRPRFLLLDGVGLTRKLCVRHTTQIR